VVSVVVPVYNGARNIHRCIENLLGQQSAGDFEIVVADDGSTDNTRDIVNSFRAGRVKAEFHEHVGRAQNRNLGAAEARGDVLVFLDSDMQASPNLLAEHAGRQSRLGDNGIVIGSVPVATTCLRHAVGRYLAAKWKRRLAALERNPEDPFLMQSGNFSIGHGFFDRLGGFDAGLDMYGAEDIDFFVRARESGGVFEYCPTAISEHEVEESFQVLYAKATEKRGSMAALRRKHALKQELKSDIPTRRLTDLVWRRFRSWRGSQRLLLALLPLLERTVSDRRVFFLYDSIIAGVSEADR
jgi:glycosyltransferase involved in cell wall biosynthesis